MMKSFKITVVQNELLSHDDDDTSTFETKSIVLNEKP